MSVSAPFVWRCLSGSTIAPFPQPAHRAGHADLSGSSAIAGFRPHGSHHAALPQWALQKGPEAGRSSGRFVHTREVRLQGLPALCPALRLPRRDPFLPLPFLHRLVSFGDFIDNMERSDSHLRCGELWLSLVRRPRRRPLADADGLIGSGMGLLAVTWSKPPAEHPISRMTRRDVQLSLVRAPALPPRHADFGSQFHTPVQPLSTLRNPRRRAATGNCTPAPSGCGVCLAVVWGPRVYSILNASPRSLRARNSGKRHVTAHDPARPGRRHWRVRLHRRLLHRSAS